MGNTDLLRQEAELTLLQPKLGNTRQQELRNSPFWPSLFKSQFVKDGEEFLLKKGTQKYYQGFRPYQNKPFHGPHHNKEAPTGHIPLGDSPLQAVTSHFPQAGGNRTTDAPEVVFDLTPSDKLGVTPLPNDPSISPPV